MKFSSICYLSDARFPSTTANSVHIMRMCEAFAEIGMKVSLVMPSGSTRDYSEGVHPEVDISSFYGLTKAPSYLKVHRKPGLLGKIAYVYRAMRISPMSSHIYYTRDLALAVAAILLSRQVIFETHFPITREGLVKGLFFRALSLSDKLLACVVITESLANEYLATLPRLRRPPAFSSGTIWSPGLL